MTGPLDTPPLRVIVVDDHLLYRQGIVRALETAGAIVVGEAEDGRSALELILRAHPPDVALVDVSMPGLDGIDVVAELARQGPDVPVVLLSAHSDEALAQGGPRGRRRRVRHQSCQPRGDPRSDLPRRWAAQRRGARRERRGARGGAMAVNDEGFERSIGLRSAVAINMTQMCGIGPFVTIPLMIAALAGRRRSSAGSWARCSRSPTASCGRSWAARCPAPAAPIFTCARRSSTGRAG